MFKCTICQVFTASSNHLRLTITMFYFFNTSRGITRIWSITRIWGKVRAGWHTDVMAALVSISGQGKTYRISNPAGDFIMLLPYWTSTCGAKKTVSGFLLEENCGELVLAGQWLAILVCWRRVILGQPPFKNTVTDGYLLNQDFALTPPRRDNLWWLFFYNGDFLLFPDVNSLSTA